MRITRMIPAVALAFSAATLIPSAPALLAQTSLRAAPSTRATSEVTLNYPEGQAPAGARPLTIRLDYGQPHLRGRALHTDSLVPYDRPWRAGANAATRLTSEVDLAIGSTNLPKGTYVLFAIPGRASWTLIVQKNGPNPEVTYDVANDIARIPMRVRASAEPLESLTLSLIPGTGANANRGELRIAWGTFVASADWVVR